jgi:hypothetical protein
MAGSALIFIGVIGLLFAAMAGIAEWQERREDREISRRFRENQRLWRNDA